MSYHLASYDLYFIVDVIVNAYLICRILIDMCLFASIKLLVIFNWMMLVLIQV